MRRPEPVSYTHLDVYKRQLQILRDQFQLGFAMRIDVAAQETALAQAKATLPPLQKQFEPVSYTHLDVYKRQT